MVQKFTTNIENDICVQTNTFPDHRFVIGVVLIRMVNYLKKKSNKKFISILQSGFF